MHDSRPATTRESCPICHRAIDPGDSAEWVPVCPILYAEVRGLRCNPACLAAERERNRLLRPEDLRPAFVGRRAAAARPEKERA